MIAYNDCNRKGKALILLARFLKRDCFSYVFKNQSSFYVAAAC